MAIPKNFILLSEGEEFIRNKSISAIENSADLSEHLEVIQSSMDLINYFIRNHDPENEDYLTIQLLGIRVFNGACSAWKLAVSGYYQTSALQLRDLLETGFLLDYLVYDRSQIAIWRTCTEDIRVKNFGPAKIRIALDDRDSFKERKREKHYKLLCNLAGHASYQGFRMLAPTTGGDAHCGPFFTSGTFKAVIEELAKIVALNGVVFTNYFKVKTRACCVTEIDFKKTGGRWLNKFYNQNYDAAEIEMLENMLQDIPDGPLET